MKVEEEASRNLVQQKRMNSLRNNKQTSQFVPKLHQEELIGKVNDLKREFSSRQTERRFFIRPKMPEIQFKKTFFESVIHQGKILQP